MTSSATSSGVVKRPLGIPATIWFGPQRRRNRSLGDGRGDAIISEPKIR